ncbi:MAG: hypothetical protein KF819_40625 [Labilithrix sp.]|nr:hypothetical protein [Labilithrix sp.]
MFSPVASLMIRPFSGYAALARCDDAPRALTGALRFMLAIGAFVAFGATGRLSPFELLGGAISFAYYPLLHAIAMAMALRAVAREIPVSRAFALFAAGYGPWYLLFCAVIAVCLFVPDPGAYVKLVGVGIVVAHVWGGVMTLALFRRGLDLSWRRAVLALVIFDVVSLGTILGYFLAAGQLLPILPR